MARSTRKSIAGTAVTAARRAISRKPAGSSGTKQAANSTAAGSAPSTKPATKTAAKPSAKKAATKNAAPAKKTTAKKTTAKKTAPAKKTAKKTAPAEKSAARKATAKQAAPAKKSTAKKAAPAKKSTAKKAAPARKATVKQAAPAKKATAKRAPAKKAAPTKKLAVKEGESAWTKAEIKAVRDELTEIRAKVAETLEAQEAELAGLMRDSGDGAGHDQADMGATSFERDHELTVVNNEREKLSQIDRALARIADGSYGVCESCGNPIGKMRVMAFPRATLCLTCKQREERR